MASVRTANQVFQHQKLPYCALCPTGGEGNCLFLAIADQLTNEDIRDLVMTRDGKAR